MSTAFELSCLACLLSCSCKHYNLVLMYVFSSAINCTYILYLFIIDCFYIALFSAFKQTHCARMWFYIQPCTMSLHESHIRKMYACSAVTCHLHFWQNDQGLLHATAVTRGWNGYRNESAQKVDPGEKILPPLLQGFEPVTFRSRVRRSNHWAIPRPFFIIRIITEL